LYSSNGSFEFWPGHGCARLPPREFGPRPSNNVAAGSTSATGKNKVGGAPHGFSSRKGDFFLGGSGEAAQFLSQQITSEPWICGPLDRHVLLQVCREWQGSAFQPIASTIKLRLRFEIVEATRPFLHAPIALSCSCPVRDVLARQLETQQTQPLRAVGQAFEQGNVRNAA
jgi:hypothetical protein